jgi:hypothetical protein
MSRAAALPGMGPLATRRQGILHYQAGVTEEQRRLGGPPAVEMSVAAALWLCAVAASCITWPASWRSSGSEGIPFFIYICFYYYVGNRRGGK